jgi:hypothetical protein
LKKCISIIYSADENTEGDPNQRKQKSGRKRYPKKPGVVWNSSLPKQCDECGKVLKGTSTLKLHKMMHADERPHTCNPPIKFQIHVLLKQEQYFKSIFNPLYCTLQVKYAVTNSASGETSKST